MSTCHIFCRVIDNHGDIGVCWRLARQLHHEHGLQVTLFVDDLAAFSLLAPAVNPTLAQQSLDGLGLLRWSDTMTLPAAADLVIEGFACNLPEPYINAMAARARPPVWINLEYLSAEPWVDSCHGLPSTHPRTGLLKHFWFPGFSARTGGLLREQGLIPQLDASDREALLEALHIAPDTRLITLFCYPQAPLHALLQALTADARPTTLVSFAGKSLTALGTALPQPLQAGGRMTRGALSVQALPLLPHGDYDRLLAAADLNLVRGEDSFVRAQWAGRPLLWQIYPQDEDAHHDKLGAFLDTSAWPADWQQAMRHWNGLGPAAWSAWLARLPAWQAAARTWREAQAARPDLASQLMRFCTNRVESPPN